MNHTQIKLSAIVCMSFLLGLFCAASDGVFLRDPEQIQQKSEGILLFIAADGRLFSDSGPTTFKSLEGVFKKWRTQGTEPGIRLILYPSMKSNSNLKTTRRIIDFLRMHHVGYDILIEPLEALPDKDLR